MWNIIAKPNVCLKYTIKVGKLKCTYTSRTSYMQILTLLINLRDSLKTWFPLITLQMFFFSEQTPEILFQTRQFVENPKICLPSLGKLNWCRCRLRGGWPGGGVFKKWAMSNSYLYYGKYTIATYRYFDKLHGVRSMKNHCDIGSGLITVIL